MSLNVTVVSSGTGNTPTLSVDGRTSTRDATAAGRCGEQRSKRKDDSPVVGETGDVLHVNTDVGASVLEEAHDLKIGPGELIVERGEGPTGCQGVGHRVYTRALAIASERSRSPSTSNFGFR